MVGSTDEYTIFMRKGTTNLTGVYVRGVPRISVTEERGHKNLRMPNDGEMFAVVTSHDGGNHVSLQCEDGQERMGRIPGRMQYRVWIEKGDVVLADPWDWQDEKADVEWRYDSQAADQLRREGHID